MRSRIDESAEHKAERNARVDEMMRRAQRGVSKAADKATRKTPTRIRRMSRPASAHRRGT